MIQFRLAAVCSLFFFASLLSAQAPTQVTTDPNTATPYCMGTPFGTAPADEINIYTGVHWHCQNQVWVVASVGQGLLLTTTSQIPALQISVAGITTGYVLTATSSGAQFLAPTGGTGGGAVIPAVANVLCGSGVLGTAADCGFAPASVLTASNPVTVTGKAISGSTNTITNVPSSALYNGGITTINGTTCPIGGACAPTSIPSVPGTQYATSNGTATTGIAASITNCGANTGVSCSILVPPSYGVTEQLSGFMIDPNNPGGNGNCTLTGNDLLVDQRYGDLQMSCNNFGYHYSLQNAVHAWQINLTAPIPNMNIVSGLNMQQNFIAGGFNIQDSATGYYNKSTVNPMTLSLNSYTPGQHIGLGVNSVSNSIGDVLGIVNFVRCPGGYNAQADEGCEAQNNRVYEWNVEYAGTLSGSPGTGATSLTVTPTQGASPPSQGAGRYLIRTNTGTITAGTIAAITSADGAPTAVTGSGTSWPVSTVVGTLGTTVSAPYVVNATNASPIVIQTALAQTIPNGASVTISGVLGNTAANGTFTITVVDSTHFSLGSSTGNGTYGGGGYILAPQVMTPSAFSVGSISGITTSTPVVIASYGNIETVIPSAVTSSTFTAIIRKTYPASATIAVGGISGMLLDLTQDEVTSSTFPNYTDEQAQGTLRYAWPVIYSTSATSATVWVSGGGAYRQLVTRWQNVSGKNGYALYQNAEVTSVMVGGNVTNTLSMAPNAIAWAAGDSVEELLFPAHSMRLGNTIIQYRYPCFATAACGAGITYNAPMIGNDQLWGVINSAPPSMYKSGGGTYDTPFGIHLQGPLRYGFALDYAPDNALIAMGCAISTTSCTNSNSQMIAVGGHAGIEYFLHDEVGNQWRFTMNGGAASLYLGYSSALSQPYFGAYSPGAGYLGAPGHSLGGAYFNAGSSCVTPGTGEYCLYMNTSGVFHTVNSSGTDTPLASGGGSSGNATSIQGVSVSTTAPTNSQSLVYSSSSSSYVPTSILALVNGIGTVVSGTTSTEVDLAPLSANTLLGALTATNPTGLPVPSCSASNNALTWTSGTGFGCNTISGGSGGSGTVTSGTANQNAYYAANGTAISGQSIAAPPYLQVGTNLYIPTDNMYKATLPSLGSWTSMSTNTGTQTTNTNGNITYTAAAAAYLAAPTQITSIEVSGTCMPVGTNTGECGIYFYDSTNGFVYTLWQNMIASSGQPEVYKLTFSGSGNPAASARVTYQFFAQQTFHFKGSISGGTLTFSASQDGGSTYQTVGAPITSVGTIAKMGILSYGSMNVFSVVVN